MYRCEAFMVLRYSYLWHVMNQQQRDGDCGDVVRTADLQDVP